MAMDDNFIDKLKDFVYITEKAIWQDIFLSSLFIPFAIYLFSTIRHWINNKRPLRQLMSGFLSKHTEVLIFLSQLSAVDENGQKTNQRYIASYPNPLPTNRSNLTSKGYQNIDPVWSESDGRCAADIFNVLGNAGKIRNVKIADVVTDWNKHQDPIFSVGFNPKTSHLINECEPIYFDTSIADHLSIKGHTTKLGAYLPNDAGILQKTFKKDSKIPVFILAGLGTLGTEVPGVFLSQNATTLGKLYGKRPFCILLKAETTKGRNYCQISGIYPKPYFARAILYLLTYWKWYKKGVFPG